MNQIMVIRPYWLAAAQLWVFDDEMRGLIQEPFVSGMPQMINHLIKDLPCFDGTKGFRLLFSALPFPGWQKKLVRLQEMLGGNWYSTGTAGTVIGDDPYMEGWLCPALFRYFNIAPPEIYVRAEPLETHHASRP